MYYNSTIGQACYQRITSMYNKQLESSTGDQAIKPVTNMDIDMSLLNTTNLRRDTPPRSSQISPTTPNLTPVRHRIAQQKKEKKVSPPVSPWRPTNIKLTEKRCPKCNLNVYKAEEVVMGGTSWHQLCFRCNQCSKSLRPNNAKNEKGLPYCEACYRYTFISQFTFLPLCYATSRNHLLVSFLSHIDNCMCTT